jgi:hypothetical protein
MSNEGNAMQIEANQSVCPGCGGALEFFSVLHHMVCAYVGPEYDFAPIATGYTCRKCQRGIVSGDQACEIVGTSARCVECRNEIVVSPAPSSAVVHAARKVTKL